MGWPIGIAATLSILVGSYIRLAFIAADPQALVVEKDYYQKAVRWDDEMQQQRRNVALGWTLTPTLGPVARDTGAVLHVMLCDASGAPLSGATVVVIATSNLSANAPLSATLGETSSGAYGARMPLRRGGQWEFRFDVLRSGQHFTADVRLDAVTSAIAIGS
jgi:hypothetical protein